MVQFFLLRNNFKKNSMHLFNFYHHNRLYRLFHSDLWLFDLSIWLHVFSRSLIAVFIPIFIYQIGYNLQEIIIYYLIYNIIDVPLNFLVRWLVTKIGARWVMIIGSLASLAFFIGFYFLTPHHWGLLFTIAALAAVYDACYWVAHLYLFLGCSRNDDNISGDESFLLILKKIAGIVAPALGAAVIIFSGRHMLIVISMVFLALSLIPLFKLKIKDRPKVKPKKFWKFFKNWDVTQDYLTAGLYQVHCTAENIIWPLFIYIILANIESVALLPIIVSVTTIIFIYFIGQISKKRRHQLIIIGSLSIALVWLTRLFIYHDWFYYFSVFLAGLFSILITIPLYSSIYEKGERIDALSAVTYRNATHMFFNVIIFTILALLVNIFQVSFVMAAGSMIIIIMLLYVWRGLIGKPHRKWFFFNIW